MAKADKVVVKKPRVKLGLPSSEFCGGLHMCNIGEKAHARLRQAFLAIIHTLCDERAPGSANEHKKQLFPVSYVLREIGTFKAEVPGKLRELWRAIDEAISDARVRGEQDGASLLKQLASGKASIADYNEATMGRTDDTE
jgi:hypothetical protein